VPRELSGVARNFQLSLGRLRDGDLGGRGLSGAGRSERPWNSLGFDSQLGNSLKKTPVRIVDAMPVNYMA
jgi:hypothetical protein